MRRRLFVALAFVAVLGFATTASADVIIDFGTGGAPVSGIFTLLGGGDASGSGIPVGAMTIDGLPGFNGVYDTSGTGANSAFGGDSNGSAVLAFNTATDTITITGGIPDLEIPNGTVLLTGSFITFEADAEGLHDAAGPDTKSILLLEALGLPLTTPFAYFGFSLTSQLIPGTDSYSVISTDVKNTAVPEPGTMLLLGTGLFGAAAAVRRRMKK